MLSRKQERILNAFVCLIMAAVISVFKIQQNGVLTLEAFVKDLIISFGVSYTVIDLLNLGAFGGRIAGKLLGEKEGILRVVVQTFIIAVIVTLFLNLVMTFLALGAGHEPGFLFISLVTYPITLLVAFPVALIAFLVGFKLVSSMK